MNQGKRKYPSIDVMKLYSTLGIDQWKTILREAAFQEKGEKLISWRYGLQAGLADANQNGKVTTTQIDVWVISRIRDVEKAMKYILKKRHPSPLDGGKLAKSVEDMVKEREAKRKRDRDFERFLNQSNF